MTEELDTVIRVYHATKPTLRNARGIADELKLDVERVTRILEKLSQTGLVRKKIRRERDFFRQWVRIKNEIELIRILKEEGIT